MEAWTWRHEGPETWRHGHRDVEAWRHGDIKRRTEAHVIFLYLFTVCSSSKPKFVNDETNGKHPFVKGLNGFVHLCLYLKQVHFRK